MLPNPTDQQLSAFARIAATHDGVELTEYLALAQFNLWERVRDTDEDLPIDRGAARVLGRLEELISGAGEQLRSRTGEQV